MHRFSYALSLLLLSAAPVANACEFHNSPGFGFYVAHYDAQGIAQEQQRRAMQAEAEKYRAQQLAAAKAQFMSRFKPLPEDAASSAPEPQSDPDELKAQVAAADIDKVDNQPQPVR